MKANQFVFGCLLIAGWVPTQAAQFDDFAYESSGTAVTITGYTGPGGAVTIPDNIQGLPVTSIGAQAFYGCTGLTNVVIPDSVTSIGEGAFSGCAGLRAFEVDELNPAFSSLEGVLFNESQTVLMACPEGKIGSYTIPASVTSIGGNAFFGCTGLTSITIPDSVTSIGGGAFQFCTGLTNVVIGNRVRHLSGFDRCTGLTSITIPNSVARIERYAFSSCTGMTNIVIPDSVSSIGEGAFSRCTGLTSLTMGKGVTSIEWSAFSGCTGLTSVYFEGNAPADDGACLETPATIYYLPGTTGWEPTYSDRPTAVWVRIEPVILDFGPSFGVQPKGFGFRISWSTNANVVVEACTNLARPAWSPVSTNTLTDGWVDFTDPDWAQYAARFYRVRGE